MHGGRVERTFVPRDCLLGRLPTSQHRKPGLPPGLDRGPDQNAAASTKWEEGKSLACVRGSHVPGRPQGGAVALLRAAKASGGEGGGRYTVAKQGARGKVGFISSWVL